MERLVCDGKHLRLGGAPFHAKGVTYGTFRPRVDGFQYPEPQQIERDLSSIAVAGFTTVRVYTLPPPELLDGARALGLRVLVGLDYPDWRMLETWGRRSNREVLTAGLAAVRAGLEACGGRPEVLALSVGNEVPSDIVRMYGRSAVQDTLSALVAAVHDGDPDLLATYTSFPTTEYLRVEGQDLDTFNVFLERPEQLRPYLQHLQHRAGERPLIVTELGLAAEVHGEAEQARSLQMQLDLVDEAGCAGATVFSWTDEWALPSGPVEGWGFGLTREDRGARPSLAVASRWATRPLRELRPAWPAVTVVVCAFNEERRLGACLDSLTRVDYPSLQVVVCDDGSTDRTLEIARRSPFEVLALPHGGLSAARNAGLAAATGEIVAYLDADATCHPEWPYHLALAFEDPGVVAAGGPNLPCPDAGLVERAVAMSPGGPVEVLLSADRAEHVPGCNMSVRAEALREIGGFDHAYVAAGDDVDVCWRLLDRGGRIGFATAAQVHHHRRDTVLGYLRQQRTYGRAERMLAGQHRHRFNRWGAARWSGFVYGGSRILPRLLRPIIYHGPMGLAPYQVESHDRAGPAALWAATLLPLLVGLALPATVGALVWPALAAVPATVLLLVVGYAAAVAVAAEPGTREPHPVRLRLLVGALHVLQPVVRTWGRLRGTPLPPRPVEERSWGGDRATWLRALHRELSARWCGVRAGSTHETWDLQVQVGPVLRCRLRTAVRWQWDPVVRRSWAMSQLAAVALLAGAALLAVDPGVAVVVLAVVAVMAAVEAVVLRTLCRQAVDRTTSTAVQGR